MASPPGRPTPTWERHMSNRRKIRSASGGDQSSSGYEPLAIRCCNKHAINLRKRTYTPPLCLLPWQRELYSGLHCLVRVTEYPHTVKSSCRLATSHCDPKYVASWIIAHCRHTEIWDGRFKSKAVESGIFVSEGRVFVDSQTTQQPSPLVRGPFLISLAKSRISSPELHPCSWVFR
jgi:hypothetical protein